MEDGTGGHDPRGILYPARLPSFRREPAPGPLADRIRWIWIPRWDLAPGRTSRQQLLPFPASNLVVMPERVTLAGPTTGASHRDLAGTGWAVGLLLRPAGVVALVDDPERLRDREVPLDEPELHADVVAAMSAADDDAGRNALLAAIGDWADRRLPAPGELGLLANRMEELVAADRTITRVDQLADRLGLGVRGLQRLCRRAVGLPPLAIIRRYRLQEAAQQLRDDPGIGVARIAAELGYADQAHLARDFRDVLGLSPRAFRTEH